MELEYEDYIVVFDEVKNMAYQYFNYHSDIQSHYKFPVNIEFSIDDLEHQSIALSNRKSEGNYLVKISAGMLKELWFLANKLSKDTNFLSLVKTSENSQKAIRNYLFYFYVDLIICHEWSHIFCGHLDFIEDCFLKGVKILSDDEFGINKILELEADSKAVTLVLARLAENYNNISSDIYGTKTSHSLERTWEIFVYSTLSLFDYWESKSNKISESHPPIPYRVFTSIMFVSGEVSDNQGIRNQLPFIGRNEDEINASFMKILIKFYIEYKNQDIENISTELVKAFKHCSKIGKGIEELNLNDYRLIKAKWT
ncbi:hypothetical protein [Psychrobacter sp. K31L]|uniref:hypothetical protein n=1 Tax=Psychrobacter sp. K31L TaxID=2820758 RepID=UPI001B32CBF9|nr:hypothetical protein [Psychrobacter sp. K31L]MBP3947203.1 hypothetical protein [Psychrobacter sp. K31L]